MRYGFLLLAFGLILAGSDLWALGGTLRADGSEFVLSLGDGRILRGTDVAGMQIVLDHQGRSTRVRIEDVSTDPSAVGGQVFLYQASVQAPDGSRQDLCLPDGKGRRAGFPVPDGNGWFSFSCTSGVEAKCVLMGYRPWDSHSSGAPLRDLYRACINLMRADYAGDDHPTTRNGTPIDVEDRFGIQTFDHVEGMAFEAVWGLDGALCVARPRIAETISLSVLSERYPRLRGATGPEVCSREAWRNHPQALLFNRSYPN